MFLLRYLCGLCCLGLGSGSLGCCVACVDSLLLGDFENVAEQAVVAYQFDPELHGRPCLGRWRPVFAFAFAFA